MLDIMHLRNPLLAPTAHRAIIALRWGPPLPTYAMRAHIQLEDNFNALHVQQDTVAPLPLTHCNSAASLARFR